MTEETITLHVIQTLRVVGYRIIAFDFPQSGTGRLLHSSERTGKNLKSVMPDVLARKGEIVLMLENKVCFSRYDAVKLRAVRDSDHYNESLLRAGVDRRTDMLKVGLSLEETAANRAAFNRHASDLDLLLTVTTQCNVLVAVGNLP